MTREEIGGRAGEGARGRSQDGVCVLEMSLRTNDCLEMVTGEMPQRTKGKGMKWGDKHTCLEKFASLSH